MPFKIQNIISLICLHTRIHITLFQLTLAKSTETNVRCASAVLLKTQLK